MQAGRHSHTLFQSQIKFTFLISECLCSTQVTFKPNIRCYQTVYLFCRVWQHLEHFTLIPSHCSFVFITLCFSLQIYFTRNFYLSISCSCTNFLGLNPLIWQKILISCHVICPKSTKIHSCITLAYPHTSAKVLLYSWERKKYYIIDGIRRVTGKGGANMID